ncbi:hypothetical protein KIL84_000639 [Mauremys mutica]|uniref:Uncharacterized protein n=1 Tax=Mauremys mutica TaxID=74926 RepID=A0A9D3WWZ0_9SAUR|nr:hypothetical protein KIL84_000639 [Mauremys mutica]
MAHPPGVTIQGRRSSQFKGSKGEKETGKAGLPPSTPSPAIHLSLWDNSSAVWEKKSINIILTENGIFYKRIFTESVCFPQTFSFFLSENQEAKGSNPDHYAAML